LDELLVKYRPVILLLVLCILSACQRQNEIQLTLIAQNATLQSEIVAVRETASVEAERLQITVDYVNTLVGRAEGDRIQMQATLVSRGTDPASIANIAPQFNTPFPVPGTPGANVTPTPLPEAALATQEVVTGPSLVNYMMAPGVGSDDCALNPTTNFTTDTAEIYVVATGMNIPAGTNIAARFSVGGQEIRHDFTPEFDINGACIWFFIDQNDLEFRPGTWSVELDLNNAPVSPPIPFTITGVEEAPVEGG
jgi:hypothetical protein